MLAISATSGGRSAGRRRSSSEYAVQSSTPTIIHRSPRTRSRPSSASRLPRVIRMPAPTSDTVVPAHCSVDGRLAPLSAAADQDRRRHQRKHQDRVQRGRGVHRQVGEGVERRQAGDAERDQQPPFAPHDARGSARPCAPTEGHERQQRQRPAQQGEGRRIDVVAQRAAGDEVARPEQGGAGERQGGEAVGRQREAAAGRGGGHGTLRATRCGIVAGRATAA